MSRRFYVLAAVLLLLTLFGLMGIAAFIESNKRAQELYNQTVDGLEDYSTGWYLDTAIYSTETAKAYTVTPTVVTK